MRHYRLWFTLVLLILIMYGAAAKWGRGGISRFSPDTLKYESQQELVLPLITIPLYRSAFEEFDVPLIEFLIAEDYWHPRDVSSPTWIIMNHGNEQWRDGHHQIHSELVWRGDDWIKWTEKNRQLAAEFWSLVLADLRQGESKLGHLFEKMRFRFLTKEDRKLKP